MFFRHWGLLHLTRLAVGCFHEIRSTRSLSLSVITLVGTILDKNTGGGGKAEDEIIYIIRLFTAIFYDTMPTGVHLQNQTYY